MTETASPDNAYASTSSDELDRPVSNSPKRPHPGRRILIAALIGVGVIGMLQLTATSTDHQIANIVSVVVGILTFLYVAFASHRWAKQEGRRLLVPGLVVIAILLFLSQYQFDGFSGELWPQWKPRFGHPARAMKSLDGMLTPPASSDHDAATAVAESASLGFLGSERTGIVSGIAIDPSRIASDTRVLWDHGIGEGWSSFAVSGDRAVTLEQRDDQECVTSYRLADGELLWSHCHQARHENALGGVGPRSTPVISGASVYAQGATGRVWCIDLETGEMNWSVDLLELAEWNQLLSENAAPWGRAASPLLVDGLCVLPMGAPYDAEFNPAKGKGLVALDAETGQVRWTAGDDQLSYASPMLITLAGVRQIVSVNERTITGHAIEDGRVLWTFPWEGQTNAGANCASVVPAGKDRFLIGKGYGGGSAVVEVTGAAGEFEAEAVWTSARVLKTKFTHACIKGDVAYGLSDGNLQAVRVSDGKLMWQQPRSTRFGQGQVVLVGDVLVVQSEPGDVAFVAADPDGYRELARLPALESKTWNIPTIAGRHLLVRNNRQAICYLLPAVR